MLRFQKIEHLLNPVTALVLVPLKSEILLLAGEGPFLRIYSHDRLSCLASERIFDSQPIHGIIFLTVASGSDGKENQTLILLWGGRSMSLLCIDHFTQSARIPFMIKRLSSIIQTDDWILDAAFRPEADTVKNVEKSFFHVVLVNSHNCIQYLRLQAISCPDRTYDWCLSHLTSGPELMLYSAHLVWSSTGRFLVAAGTIFGEVLLWSFHGDAITFHPEYPISSLLHYIFHGHEGSVFGVRISEEPTDSLSIPAGRCLASCSDDRTIRVWDISRVDKESALDRSDRSIEDGSSPYSTHETSSLPVSTTMGHNSRIWGLRFLRHSREGSLLLSFGEDATSQIWHLQTQSNATDPGQVGETGNAHLQHECTFEYHAKRNIWSATAHRGTDGNYTISTGGADGRIICFGVEDHGGLLRMGKSWTTEWTMNNVLDELNYDDGTSSFEELIAAKLSVKILPENIFTAFQGHWNVYRRLESEICTYPSGIFQGTASFEMRPPTDPAYDAEYLYLEYGQFSSEQGLKIAATRRYVYRFQRNINTISAWFVKAEEGSPVDYLFHYVNFTSCQQGSFLQANGRRRCFLEAAGQHLCIEDDYQAKYLFKFDDCRCDEWELTYNVKGPKKAYSATAQYTRDDSQHSANDTVESADVPETMVKSGGRAKAGSRKAVSGAGTFSTYAWADEDQLLASTTQGYLLLGDISCSERHQYEITKNQIRPKGFWARFGQLTDLESSCFATSIQYPGIVLLAGRGGNMYFYQHHKRLIKSQIQFPDKATYLKSHLMVRWRNETSPHKPRKIELGIIASCLRPLTGYAFYVDVDLENSSCSVSSSFILTLLPYFIVTSSCFANTKDMLVLGSRNGALAIYEPLAISNDNTNIAPSLVLHGIHGRDAVTVIENLPITSSNSDMETYILTAGKDGTYSIHLITAGPRNRDTAIGFQTVHVCKPSFGPNIEGACFNRTSGELWLWGFSSKDFVVWNESCKTRVLTVECGGAHRNWAFLPGHDGGAGGQLAWTKASSCRIYSQPRASHQVLQHGGHGREIKAVAISPPIKVLDGSIARFVATGAEDTAIRIFRVSGTYKPHRVLQGLQGLGVFTKHTSGLQQLRWSQNGQLLFSAAACEEFFVWRVRPAPCVEIGVMCEAICPPVTESADLRIMGFDVMEMENHGDGVAGDPLDHCYLLSMVYSDSSVRVYSYESDSTNPSFHLVSTGTYTTYCLTQALHLHFDTSIHLCTASTDGHISFWSLKTPLAEEGIMTSLHKTRIAISNPHGHSPSVGYAPNLTWQSRTKIHQSSIKAMCSLHLSPSTFLLATGGDDGALGFTRVTFSSNSSLPDLELLSISVLLVPNAHAAAVTAVTYLGPGVHHSTEGKEGGLEPQTQQHSFATTGPDQKLRIWLVSIDLGKPGVEGLRVEKGDCVSTAVADAACLEGFGWGDGDGDDDGDEPEESSDDDERREAEEGDGNETDNKGEDKNQSMNHMKASRDDDPNINETNPRIKILVAGIGLEVWNCAEVWRKEGRRAGGDRGGGRRMEEAGGVEAA